MYFSRPGSFESGKVVFTVFSWIVTSAQLVAFTHAHVCPDNKLRHKFDTSFDKDDTSFEKGRIRGQIKGKDIVHELHELYFNRNGKSDCRLPFLAL